MQLVTLPIGNPHRSTSPESPDPSSGAAAAPNSELTQPGSIIGTPSYMSPEQCSGLRVGPASDIYSLGAIAYQMLTSSFLFEGTQAELLSQHLLAKPPSIRDRRRDVPRDVEQLILTTLAKDPADRPTAMELGRRLRLYVEGEAPILERGEQFYNSRRAILVSLSLLVYTQVSILVFSLFFVRFYWAVPYAVLVPVSLGLLLLARLELVAATSLISASRDMAGRRALIILRIARGTLGEVPKLVGTGVTAWVVSICKALRRWDFSEMSPVNRELLVPILLIERLDSRTARKRSRCLGTLVGHLATRLYLHGVPSENGKNRTLRSSERP